jgi:hypothetical protein
MTVPTSWSGLYPDEQPFVDPGYTVIGGTGWLADNDDDEVQLRPTPTPPGTVLGTDAGLSTVKL